MSETPLMVQFRELKEQAGSALLLFRMGDFYELFGEDAVVASRILGLTLTSRDKGKENPLPMAGMPFHSADSYIQKLLQAGHKVAIGEQVEDPEEAKKRGSKAIVRREIIRMFTPAVNFEPTGREASYLGHVQELAPAGTFLLVLLDASTGEARVSEPLTAQSLQEALAALPIPHLLHAELTLPTEALQSVRGDRLIEAYPAHSCSMETADRLLKTHYGVGTLDALLPSPQSRHGLGALLYYTCRALKTERLSHLQVPQPLTRPSHLQLGPRAAAHLDLTPSAEGNPNLLNLIDSTGSALGSRRLRQWVLEPLARPEAVRPRQEAVREAATEFSRSDRLRKALSEIYDLDRLLGRVSAGLANPRDTFALGKSLAQGQELLSTLNRFQSPALRALAEQMRSVLPRLAPLAQRILSTQNPEAPFSARDGSVFVEGASPELDRLIALSRDGQQWLVELEARERTSTGISSLKVRYNRVFGYYIEVTTANLKNVPPHYLRKQTTVGGERFFTEELKRFEDDFVSASARRLQLELRLFEELLQAIRAEVPSIMAFAKALGELDALLALARLASRPGWVFPEIDETLELEIEGGRHPLVDESAGGRFVPNSVRLVPGERQCLLITGPNMGGKSTLMRQVALIVVLGQMGAPVPARRARWGWVSSVHTRIGAHDAIARGQSTFMVEMIELAHILHRADERSLVILDEIGRGTSTYDGMSVAWATLEWITREIRARTFFATHYHELTVLPADLPGLANAHMAVDNPGGQLRFLYELREGPTSESFGVQVAALAGLPQPVIARAWQVLERLEEQSAAAHESTSLSSAQLSLFELAATAPPLEHPVRPSAPEWVRELEALDPNSMTPLQALTFLVDVKKKLGEQRTG